MTPSTNNCKSNQWKLIKTSIMIIFGLVMISVIIQCIYTSSVNTNMSLNIQSHDIDDIHFKYQHKHAHNIKHGKKKKIFANHYTINNPLCRILFPSSILLFKHHKTGTILSNHLRKNLIDFCDIIYKSQQRYAYHFWLKFTNFRDIDDDQESSKLQGDAQDNLRFHFWRDPVLTIVSGFNYHMTCLEIWASTPITTSKLFGAAEFFGFETDFDKLYQIYMNLTWTFNIDKEIPVWINRMSDKQKIAPRPLGGKKDIKYVGIRRLYYYYLNDLVNQVRFKKYGDYYGFDIDFDDTKIHSKYNMFDGNDQQRINKFAKFKK